jgi:hypothetical protein
MPCKPLFCDLQPHLRVYLRRKSKPNELLCTAQCTCVFPLNSDQQKGEDPGIFITYSWWILVVLWCRSLPM